MSNTLNNIPLLMADKEDSLSVHSPYAGREKPYKVAWRDGKQRSAYFATEDEAGHFNALPGTPNSRT